eukprot:TRINITY_DN776204_c0_g1_i1.p1 TRINITY_DN776204_c0_g1~~TRINITY_DN776204_c0_g1_i1.p1  ORF type:complete len:216 (-),score=61.41 TRINITY_DN776204_c0_g1_i1:90-737(-)
MNVQCPTCRTVMTVPATGGLFQCPGCRGQIQVPPQMQQQAAAPTPDMIFAQIDTSRDGQISHVELTRALSMGGYKPFNPKTVTTMIKMFDTDRTGQIGRSEFMALWKFLNDWQQCFNTFDADRSGTISASELATAFTTFGYQLTPAFVSKLTKKYDTDKSGNVGFDEFIQCMLEVQKWTQAFQKVDTDRDGIITLQLSQFLELVMASGSSDKKKK